MNQEKKVIFLFLSLIALIVLCVYTHLDTIKTSQVSTIDKKEMDLESSTEKEQIENKEESLVSQETLPEIKEETIKENNDEPIQEEEKEVSEKLLNETIEKEEVSIQENSVEEQKEEVKEEPLITTPDKYIREGSEKRIEELSKQTQLLQIKISDYIKQNPIVFKRGSDKITKNSNKAIKTVIESLNEFPNIKIEIAGHTDAVGAAELNQAISLKRAKSVMNRLIYYGINKDRMIARGYGENVPLVENSPNGYSKINRRVEFNIVEE